jgi:hypothetical protein
MVERAEVYIGFGWVYQRLNRVDEGSDAHLFASVV